MNYPAPRASEETRAWEEDLPWLATRSVELGRELCTCSAFYHELRGPLRASGFIREINSRRQILASTISPLIKNHTRVLIAGSADAGIFSTVMQVSDNVPSDPRLDPGPPGRGVPYLPGCRWD